MKSTLTELRAETKKVLRPVLAGQHVSITDHGKPLARISPEYETVTLPAAELRKLEITDKAILAAIDASRE